MYRFTRSKAFEKSTKHTYNCLPMASCLYIRPFDINILSAPRLPLKNPPLNFSSLPNASFKYVSLLYK